MERSTLEAGTDATRRAGLRQAVGRLHRWYRRCARDLPWRRTRDPYAIWVSEVMLQQTQAATVAPYYARWMAAFPTLRALGAASEQQVLRLWEGLGYYSRARNLHRAAQRVCAEGRGALPRTAEALRALPGVGRYTAAAVASIAFDERVAVVDGNVRRVLCRLCALALAPGSAAEQRELEHLAAELLGRRAAARHNQAMMELGAVICTPRQPRCGDCPLRDACRAHLAGEAERFPLRKRRAAVPEHRTAVAVLEHRGLLLLVQRPYGARFAGLWDLPAADTDGDRDRGRARLVRALRERFGVRVKVTAELPEVRHALTHLRLVLQPFRCELVAGAERAADGADRRWVGPAELASTPMPRAARRILAEARRARAMP